MQEIDDGSKGYQEEGRVPKDIYFEAFDSFIHLNPEELDRHHKIREILQILILNDFYISRDHPEFNNFRELVANYEQDLKIYGRRSIISKFLLKDAIDLRYLRTKAHEVMKNILPSMHRGYGLVNFLIDIGDLGFKEKFFKYENSLHLEREIIKQYMHIIYLEYLKSYD